MACLKLMAGKLMACKMLTIWILYLLVLLMVNLFKLWAVIINTVATVGFKVGAINVYDSMDVPMKTKEGIALMMTTYYAHIYVTFPYVQQQKSGWDGGLCAIAYAYILYNGQTLAHFCLTKPNFMNTFCTVYCRRRSHHFQVFKICIIQHHL